MSAPRHQSDAGSADLDRCEVHRYTPADAMRPAASACRSMTAEDKVVHVLRMWTHYA